MRLPPIQEVIHWLEVGQGAQALRRLTAALLLLTVLFWYDFYQFRNFSNPEAMEAAQLARNLSRGEGFTTQVIRPLTVQLVEDHLGVDARLSRQPHPDLTNPPLYPVLLAGWMKVMPFHFELGEGFWRYQPEMMIMVFNQILYLLMVWMAFRLARRILNGEAAALLAILLFASELLWRFSTSGLPTMLALLLFVSLLEVLSRLEEAARQNDRSGRWFLRWGAAAGLLLGGLALTRYGFIALLVPISLFYLFFLGRRAAGALATTFLVASLVLIPWLVRNYQISGTLLGVRGYAAYADTLRLPEDRIDRSFKPDLTVVQNTDLIRKAGEGLRQLLAADVLQLGGTWVGAFFLAGLLAQYREPRISRLRVFLLLCLVTCVLVQCVGRTALTARSPIVTAENLLIVLTPGVFLVGVAFLQWMVARMQLPFPEFRHVISTVVVVLAAAPLAVRILPPRVVPISYPPYYPPHLSEAAQFLKPSEVLMSDLPWATAWYGDRASVWTTMDTRESFFTFNDQHKAVAAVLLSPLTTDAQFRRQILQSRDHDWSRLVVEVLLRTNVPPGFPLKSAWRRGTPDHLFLADRPRWLEGPPAAEEPPAPNRPTEP